jgi:hypothetical protein
VIQKVRYCSKQMLLRNGPIVADQAGRNTRGSGWAANCRIKNRLLLDSEVSVVNGRILISIHCIVQGER